MIAALPMYDFPEVVTATDALFSAWRAAAARHGIDAPAVRDLATGSLLDHWRDPAVLLTQACGYPYRAALAGTVVVVGTFDYDAGLVGVPAGHYRSVLVTRAGLGPAVIADGVAVAINSLESLSGCVSLGATLAEMGITHVGPIVETGAHARSVEAVADGRADLASIDAVSWALLGDVRPHAVAGLEVIAQGPVVPSLPLVTPRAELVAPLRASLADALADLAERAPEVLTALRIRRFVPLDGGAYDHTLVLARAAARLLPVDLLPAV